MSVSRYDVVRGAPLVVTGRFTAITGADYNQVVVLESVGPRRYGRIHTTTARTNTSGRFRFYLEPSVNLRLTAHLEQAPEVRSSPRRIFVYPKESVEVEALSSVRVALSYYAIGPPRPFPGARWAYFYYRVFGSRTYHRVGRARVRFFTDRVRARKVVSARRVARRGYVTACTKSSPIAGMGRGHYAPCGRRTLPAP